MTRKKDSWYLESRRTNAIPIATTNLIICCGEETEKNYFRGAVEYFKSFERNSLPRFFIETDPVDPLAMAENVSKFVKRIERDKSCLLDNVWVVFDKDEFTNENFNRAISKINNIKHKETKFHVLWSNQCFELWLLLNFVNMQSAIGRADYIDKMTNCIGQKYRKNIKDIFDLISKKGGSIVQAIKYAKQLRDESISPAVNDPATTVYEFFEFYDKYLCLTEV